jgi:pimeloyl-ACP methyl ester carboxylesterase
LLGGHKDGLIHLQEGAKPLWYSDLSPAEQDAAWRDLNKVQTRASMCYFPPFITSQIKGIPKTYVLCEQDKVVDPAYQEAFAQVGEYNKVVRLPTGHAPLLSAPERIVDIIIETAAAAAAAA